VLERIDLDRLFEEHYPRLIRLAGLITRSPVDAEDAVQNGLERAWRHRAEVRDGASIVKWLDRIVVREAIRTRGRRLRPLAHHREAFPGAPPVEFVALDVALAELPTEQRAAVVLHHWAGYSLSETAELMGTGIETARSRLRLARLKLRAALRGDSSD
jgi:RNA polymerase sigma-70 factor (ECF subfamily)